jgi:DNA invertase Pin-like site-specific DNA recombinase
VITLIDELVANYLTILILKQNLKLNKDQVDIQSITMTTMLSFFAQMERSMISRRTKAYLQHISGTSTTTTERSGNQS